MTLEDRLGYKSAHSCIINMVNFICCSEINILLDLSGLITAMANQNQAEIRRLQARIQDFEIGGEFL